MADDAIPAPANLHFDELNKLRVLAGETGEETTALRDECKDFIEKFEEYRGLVGTFTGLMDQIGKEVEEEKMKAIGARNLLKTILRQRETQRQQLKELIAEKRVQLERYKVEVQQLQQHEQEQREFVEQFAASRGTA